MDAGNREIEALCQEIGKEIFESTLAQTDSVFDLSLYSSKLMDWSMKDPKFKVALFRFVDVLPALDSSAAVIKHVQEYFSPVSDSLPTVLKAGLHIPPKSLAAKAAAKAIKSQVKTIASSFIAGEDFQSAFKNIDKVIRDENRGVCICLLGDQALSELESQKYLTEYKELVASLSKKYDQKEALNISVKLSTLYSQAKAINFAGSVDILSARLREIFLAARSEGLRVYVDMEETDFIDITLQSFKQALDCEELNGFSDVGIILQAYARRTEKDLDSLLTWLNSRNSKICVRLVKGAYWDMETMHAEQNNWPNPLWTEKSNSDAMFEKLSLTLLKNSDLVYPAFGSHNIRSLCYAIAAADKLSIGKDKYELQFLYGMADPIKKEFQNRGEYIRDYVPIGELIPGMGYLVRRLLENTSNEGFLRRKFKENETAEVLLETPLFVEEQEVKSEPKQNFCNYPLIDFSIGGERAETFAAAEILKDKLSEQPEVACPIVSGKEFLSETEEEYSIESTCPDDNSFVLGKIHLANTQLADSAVKKLREAAPAWNSTPLTERASVLIKASEILATRRLEFISLICLETGKPIGDADADVCEAIDFLNYYAELSKSELASKEMLSPAGEKNLLSFKGRGVTLVISPWNFPLAIPAGMFAAALVCGNTVALKPAEQSSLVAWKLFSCFLEAGMPEDVAAFLPGLGEEIGAHLCTHNRISTIAFTGSEAVGLEIMAKASSVNKDQRKIKRIVCELGGKNAIIVDSDAELDEAVAGVIQSCFGYAGQKCSACSRAIVVGEKTYEAFSERLKHAVESLHMGAAWEPATLIGPVIDEKQKQRIEAIIESGRNSAEVLVEHKDDTNLNQNGNYVHPIVFAGMDENHPLNRVEVFGPVLNLLRADSIEQAAEISNNVRYGLTGGIYSRSPGNIEYLSSVLEVGNLYINRKCTGALVGRQPFGGVKLSGAGSKAGGPGYLKEFCQTKCISENTQRRGFSPELL